MNIQIDRVFQIWFLLPLLMLTLNSELAGQSFRVGVVKKNITPVGSQQLLGYGARKSTGIHDSIYHRIVVMDDGDSQFFIVSSDLGAISPSEYDRVKDMLIGKYGISGSQFWWSVTHTHSAPEVGPPGLPIVFLGERYRHQFDTAYTNQVVRELVKGIEEARQVLKPAMLGVGWGYSNANINRRARDLEGLTRLGMNPDGPVDRRIGILKIVDEKSGKLLTLIANYAIHGTVMGGENLLISGDVPGIVSNYVEEVTGAPLLFINGAAGNIAPIYSVYPNPSAGHLTEFRVMLGDKILQAQREIVSYRKNVKLKYGEITMRTPRKKDLGWTDDLAEYFEQKSDSIALILLPIRFLKIDNDIAIWSAPLELFCEISNEIRDRSPFPYTFYFGYTNGWLGYMLTEEEIRYGGYETSVSPYVPLAGRQLTEAVTSYLKGELLSK